MANMIEQHTIGQVAEKTGITIDTLRYYERIGLLPGVKRVSGQRRFSESPEASRTDVREMANEKLKEIRERLEVLLTLQQELTELVDECRIGASGPCPIIQSLDQSSQNR